MKTSCFAKPYEASRVGNKYTLCVKDCGLHNQSIYMIILFACLFGWLDSSRGEISKIKAQSLKKLHVLGSS